MVPSAHSEILYADAIDLARHVASGSVDLAYLDPPFAVGVKFGAREGSGWRAKGNVAYDDRWPSIESYLDWLEARIAVVHGLLSREGSMWLHLDHRAVHDAKMRCDRVFGRERFVAEIIWVPGNGSKSRRVPGTTHQTILVYAKTKTMIWNARDPILREPYAPTSQSMHFKKVDADGRRYRERTIGKKTYRYYADEGRAIGSVWTDCPSMSANTPLRSETTGYPTQKPEKLLERIVRGASREGSLVLDPFCGSGTTLAVAKRNKRRFFGCDTSPLAIRVAKERVRQARS
jgi:site-specific DNA-methyltransferase (adenine-specific)